MGPPPHAPWGERPERSRVYELTSWMQLIFNFVCALIALYAIVSFSWAIQRDVDSRYGQKSLRTYFFVQ